MKARSSSCADDIVPGPRRRSIPLLNPCELHDPVPLPGLEVERERLLPPRRLGRDLRPDEARRSGVDDEHLPGERCDLERLVLELQAPDGRVVEQLASEGLLEHLLALPVAPKLRR